MFNFRDGLYDVCRVWRLSTVWGFDLICLVLCGDVYRDILQGPDRAAAEPLDPEEGRREGQDHGGGQNSCWFRNRELVVLVVVVVDVAVAGVARSSRCDSSSSSSFIKIDERSSCGCSSSSSWRSSSSSK